MGSSAGDAVAAAIRKLMEATEVTEARQGPDSDDDWRVVTNLLHQTADQLEYVHAQLEDMPGVFDKPERDDASRYPTVMEWDACPEDYEGTRAVFVVPLSHADVRVIDRSDEESDALLIERLRAGLQGRYKATWEDMEVTSG